MHYKSSTSPTIRTLTLLSIIIIHSNLPIRLQSGRKSPKRGWELPGEITEEERKAIQEDFRLSKQKAKEKNIPVHIGDSWAFHEPIWIHESDDTISGALGRTTGVPLGILGRNEVSVFLIRKQYISYRICRRPA
jgi:hypothetical protein